MAIWLIHIRFNPIEISPDARARVSGPAMNLVREDLNNSIQALSEHKK